MKYIATFVTTVEFDKEPSENDKRIFAQDIIDAIEEAKETRYSKNSAQVTGGYVKISGAGISYGTE